MASVSGTPDKTPAQEQNTMDGFLTAVTYPMFYLYPFSDIQG